MQKKWKFILGGLLIVVAAAVILFTAIQGLEAELLVIQPRDIAKTFKEEGKVISAVERPIHALYGGEIRRLYVEEGQGVKKGDPLAVISTEELTLQLRQLQAQLQSLQGEEEKTLFEPQQSTLKSQELLLQQARRDLEIAATDLDRMKKLYETGGISKKEYEEVFHTREAAATNLELQTEALSQLKKTYNPEGGTGKYYTGRKEALQAQIDLLQYQLERCALIAPVDGTVANLTAREGEIPNPAAPLMNIFQQDKPAIEIFIRAADVQNVETGMQVALLPDRGAQGQIYPGTVQKIAPTAVETVSVLGLAEQRVKVIVEPVAEKPPALFPGYKLDVEFTIAKKENKLIVPKTVLFPFKEEKALWVVREGKAAIQPVKTGLENDQEIVIEQGLKAGDLVLLNPRLEGLKAGKKIISGAF
ncbi:MAG: efflux RND transporter periplasmic adaptor subunit [Dethiobacteria bacterium]|jgi:HlyD family secretion protein